MLQQAFHATAVIRKMKLLAMHNTHSQAEQAGSENAWKLHPTLLKNVLPHQQSPYFSQALSVHAWEFPLRRVEFPFTPIYIWVFPAKKYTPSIWLKALEIANDSTYFHSMYIDIYIISYTQESQTGLSIVQHAEY